MEQLKTSGDNSQNEEKLPENMLNKTSKARQANGVLPADAKIVVHAKNFVKPGDATRKFKKNENGSQNRSGGRSGSGSDKGAKQEVVGENFAQMNAFALYIQSAGNASEVARQLKMDESTIRRWAVKYNWPEKRIEIEAAARAQLRKKLTGGRKQRLEMMLDLGVTMMERSKSFLDTYGVESGQVAIAAAKGGAELISKVDLIPDLLLKIATASPEELSELRQRVNTMMATPDVDEDEEWAV